MKNLFVFFNIMLIICFILISCESDNNNIINDPEFSIKFSDGTIINEKDIVFYDSSTCNLFLKNKLQLDYVFGEIPNVDFLEFSVYVDKDAIYQGIVYPAFVAAPSPNPYFIASYSYPNFESDIISLRYMDFYTNSIDKRNNPQIIKSLEKTNLLKHGITCSIDSIYISSYIDSSVICVFTIQNHDFISYYIPDPNKMGAGRFSFCIGGLYLKNKKTNEDIYRNYVNSVGWEVLTMDDLSLLESKSENTCTYEFIFNTDIDK